MSDQDAAGPFTIEELVSSALAGMFSVKVAPEPICPSCKDPIVEMTQEPRPGSACLCVCGARLIFTERLDVRLMDEDDRRWLFQEDPAALQALDETADSIRFLNGLLTPEEEEELIEQMGAREQKECL